MEDLAVYFFFLFFSNSLGLKFYYIMGVSDNFYDMLMTFLQYSMAANCQYLATKVIKEESNRKIHLFTMSIIVDINQKEVSLFFLSKYALE